MSTIKVLRLRDGSNQMNLTLYYLDGTYNYNFPLSIVGRIGINRRFFPIAIAKFRKSNYLIAFLLLSKMSP